MKKNIKKGLFILLAITMVCFTTSHMNNIVSAANKTVTAQYDYDGVIESQETTLLEDTPTNLLKDNSNNDLQHLTKDGKKYDLKEVSISRYRQKVRIEYYLGDYTASTFIGADEGFADYDDAVSWYIMKIDEINSAFSQTIPTTYRMVSLEQGKSFSYIPAYSGDDTTYTVKVLVASVKKYNVSATKYQNRQDKVNPNPIGMNKTDIDSTNDFWKVNALSTSFQAIVGQTVNLKNIGQFRDTDTTSNRTGSLKHLGTFDATNTYNDLATTTLTVTDSLSTSIQLAAFYEVEDYSNPVVKPGYSSSMTSGATITFTGGSEDWKTPVATETLQLDNPGNVDKLQAYPFQLDDDPFENPEYPLYYVPTNWALGHRIEITYNYAMDPNQPSIPTPETTDPNTPSAPSTNPSTNGNHTLGKKSVNTLDTTDILKQLLLIGGSLSIVLGMLSYNIYKKNNI